MPTPPALPAHLVGRDEQTVAPTMESQFAAWEQTLPEHTDKCAEVTHRSGGSPPRRVSVCPHPTEANGLPEGWVAYPCGSSPSTDPEAVSKSETFVVRRTAGGWGLVFHSLHFFYGSDEREVPTTTLWVHTSPTLDGLYAQALEMYGLVGGADSPEQNIRVCVMGYYDMSDPTEAAEATLVGLGAPITVFPKALTE